MPGHAVLLLWLAQATSAVAATQPCSAAPARAAASIPPASQWITELATLAAIPSTALRGRHLSAVGAHVAGISPDGFWVADAQTRCRIFVVPAEGPLVDVSVGDVVDLQGEFRVWADPVTRPGPSPFLYAYTVREAPPAATSGE